MQELRKEPDMAVAAPRPCLLADGFHCIPWQEAFAALPGNAWHLLATSAASPNPFYERWFLLPSLEAFDPDGDIALALLIDGGQLCGLMPVQRSSAYHGRRIPHLAAWMHPNMFCGVPLVIAGYEAKFWTACLDHFDTEAGGSLFFHLCQVSPDDPVIRNLRQVCDRANRPLRTAYAAERALLESTQSPERYLACSMTTKARKELRRQRKRVSESGSLSVVRHRCDEGIDDWVDAFLALEERGWKGEAGSAIAADPRTKEVFRKALESAAALGRLERLTLTCDDAPIAMLATFLTPPGSFAFKTTFDEDFARYSPGLQLQVENLALLEDENIRWCDSCAVPGHSMIERIWSERRKIAYYTIPVGHGWRRALGAVMAWIEEKRQEARQ